RNELAAVDLERNIAQRFEAFAALLEDHRHASQLQFGSRVGAVCHFSSNWRHGASRRSTFCRTITARTPVPASRNTPTHMASIWKMKMNNGARATVGAAYTAETQGSMKSRAVSLLAMAMPRPIPTTAARAKPTKNSFRLTSTCRVNSPVTVSWTNLTQISDS